MTTACPRRPSTAAPANRYPRLPSADRRLARLVAVLALLAPLALGACGPFREVAGAPPPTATASRARATPVPTAAGRPNPVPIEPPTGLLPERTLAFVSDRGGQIDLWLEEIDEAGQPVRTRRLTDDAAIESFPTW